jgi:hypothetical protein
MCIYPHSGALTKGYGSRQQAPKILRASPSASTLTHPRGLLGKITSVNRQHRSHIIFECGLLVPWKVFSGQQRLGIIRVRVLLSLESSSLGQQHLRTIPLWASVPRIVFIGPTAPPNYSSAGFGPSNHFLWASSAFALFECGLRSIESSSLGQQRLRIIWVWALVPRIVFIGPTTPLNYSRAGFGPSNHFLRASSAFTLFKCGLWSLNRLLWASSASELFECGLRSLESSSSG